MHFNNMRHVHGHFGLDHEDTYIQNGEWVNVDWASSTNSALLAVTVTVVHLLVHTQKKHSFTSMHTWIQKDSVSEKTAVVVVHRNDQNAAEMVQVYLKMAPCEHGLMLLLLFCY